MGIPELTTHGAHVSVRRIPHTSWRRVIADSFRLFHPAHEVRHPVMFCVYVLFLFLVALTLVPGVFPDIARSYNPDYYLAVTILLFLTLWFANLGQAIAEAQGPSPGGQPPADPQRGPGAPGPTGRPPPLGRLGHPACWGHGRGPARRTDPHRGAVIHGAALIDESMMTGESEAVIRESGGDKTSVLGGTRLLQGTIRIRVTAVRGESFLDRLIHLVEGQGRESTPNEIALGVLLYAFTITLFTVVGLVHLFSPTSPTSSTST